MIANDTTQRWEARELADRIESFPRQFRVITEWLGEDPYIAARRQGKIDIGAMAAGQSAAVIHDVPSAGDVLRRLVDETDSALGRLVPGQSAARHRAVQ